MFCSISGELMTTPVVSKIDGRVFEKEIIMERLDQEGLAEDDLIEIVTGVGAPPREKPTMSVGEHLNAIHVQYQQLQLQLYDTQVKLGTAKKELSQLSMLYESSQRVAERAVAEAEQLKSENAEMRSATLRGGESEEPEKNQIPSDVVERMIETYKTLVAKRKKRSTPKNLRSEKDIFVYANALSIPHDDVKGANCVDFAENGGKELLVGCGDSNIYWHSLAEGDEETIILAGHVGSVNGVKFLPSNKMFLSCSSDGTVKLWRAKRRKGFDVAYTSNVHAAKVVGIDIHPYNDIFGSFSEDNRWVLHDIINSKVIASFWGLRDSGGYSSGTFHPDGGIAALGCRNGAVELWDIRSETQAFVLREEGKRGDVTSVDFSENGYLFASSLAGAVRIWDLRKISKGNPEVQHRLEYDNFSQVERCRFDASARYLCVAGTNLDIYETRNWNKIFSGDISDANGTDVLLTSNAENVVATFTDGSVRLWGDQE